ncbi:MAG: hypothetical protein KIT11_00720 [Fimbriimonadaceae bacterium]|nr:hypothetical protein [Fimbriimonadaceae bacterium]QYK55104.1 MAG: hypothetical protein KF733_08815 [Fimbriimonadaceae bacterium]
MRRFRTFALAAGIVLALGATGFKMIQDPGSVDRAQLREMLVQLGYEVKDLNLEVGKEKYVVTFTRDGLDIPVGFEISPSNSYIWLTVNLGKAPEDGAKGLELLRENAKRQPTQFYITDGKLLMAGLPVENRAMTNAILRQRAEAISSTVGASQSTWKQ